MLWQGWFFLQTDLYYLIVTVLGCVDLHSTAEQMLNNAWHRLTGRAPRFDPEGQHPRDRRVARWYSVLMVFGYGFAIITLTTAVLPVAVRVFSQVLSQFFGHGGGGLGLVDSVVFLTLSVGELAVAAYLSAHERRNKRQTPSAGPRQPLEPAWSSPQE